MDREDLAPLAFVMTLSHSRGTAIVWSRAKDQVHWLQCHNLAFERLGGVPATNRVLSSDLHSRSAKWK